MKLVFATNNAHKLEEVRQILGPGFEVVSLSELGCHEDIPETADTFQGNALQKARYIREHYGVDCFADDTGLEVTALGGAPGVHSARYAGDHDSNANIVRLLHELEGKEDRSAQFRTVVALLLDGKEMLFEGIVKGHIATERHGQGGFGYDPVFIPDGFEQSFSQMSAESKNSISHRGRAVGKLAEFLKNL